MLALALALALGQLVWEGVVPPTLSTAGAQVCVRLYDVFGVLYEHRLVDCTITTIFAAAAAMASQPTHQSLPQEHKDWRTPQRLKAFHKIVCTLRLQTIHELPTALAGNQCLGARTWRLAISSWQCTAEPAPHA